MEMPDELNPHDYSDYAPNAYYHHSRIVEALRKERDELAIGILIENQICDTGARCFVECEPCVKKRQAIKLAKRVSDENENKS